MNKQQTQQQTQQTQPVLKGIGASPGFAKGSVRVVNGQEDAQQFQRGDILVAPMTDPSMVMMMNKAEAIITDRGGRTSHAAIIARELGIPCIVATQHATTTLQTGMMIELNGTTGEIKLITI